MQGVEVAELSGYRFYGSAPQGFLRMAQRPKMYGFEIRKCCWGSTLDSLDPKHHVLKPKIWCSRMLGLANTCQLRIASGSADKNVRQAHVGLDRDVLLQMGAVGFQHFDCDLFLRLYILLMLAEDVIQFG